VHGKRFRRVPSQLPRRRVLGAGLLTPPPPAARFGVAPFRLRPAGAITNQPRATPWERQTTRINTALKGHDKDRLLASMATSSGAGGIEQFFRPFQGSPQHVFRIPGRCPGLICCGPFGAKSKERNTKSRALGAGLLTPPPPAARWARVSWSVPGRTVHGERFLGVPSQLPRQRLQDDCSVRLTAARTRAGS